MSVDNYYIKVNSRLNHTSRFIPFHTTTTETEMELAIPNTYTNVLLTIAAESQGRVGPEVMIGIYSGNVNIRTILNLFLA